MMGRRTNVAGPAPGEKDQVMRDFKAFFHHFFQDVHLVRHILAGLGVILLAVALVIWWAEESSLGNALYLTLITGLTVGYGDISPVTLVGRCASVIAAMIGIILTGIYVAIATNAVSRSLNDDDLAGR